MALLDVLLPKDYRNGRVLFEQNLDRWRLAAQDGFSTANLNLSQISKDCFLPGYEYDNDGNPNYAIPLEARINQLLGGGAPLTGTSHPSWTINSTANSATMTTSILTAPRTYQFPDVSGTFLMNFATQTGNIIGINQTVGTGGSPFIFNLAGGAHTTLTASAEASDFILNLARTVQFATGNITDQRAFRITAPTYAFVAASTITNASTVYIDGAPAAGANATLTNSYSLFVDAGRARFDGDIQVAQTQRIDLDTDLDTSIRATADDNITFEINAVDAFIFNQTSIDMSSANKTIALNNSTNALNINTDHLVFDATNDKIGIGTATLTQVGFGGLRVSGEICTPSTTTDPPNAAQGYLTSNNSVHCAGGGLGAGGLYVNTGDWNVDTYVRNAAGDYTVTLNTQTINSASKAWACNLNSALVSAQDGAIIIATTTTTVQVGTIQQDGTAQDSNYSVFIIGSG